MSFILASRVRETTTTTGTGSITLAGAVTGYQTFASGIGLNNQTYYTIADQSGNNWEVGSGTVTLGVLSRDVIYASSNSNALVNFTAGTKDVFCDYPAYSAVAQKDVGTSPNQIPLNQYLGTMAWQDVNTYKLNFVVSSDVGYALNQVPLNQYLGTMAYQDAKSYLTNQVVTNQFSIQPTITTITASGSTTLTIAQLLTYIVQVTQTAAVTLVLPTGTLSDAGVLGGGSLINTSFQWSIINLGSVLGAITVSGGSAHTYVGSATVAIGTSAIFRTIKTAQNTFITYRIS